jgi:hypothetical protein
MIVENKELFDEVQSDVKRQEEFIALLELIKAIGDGWQMADKEHTE